MEYKVLLRAIPRHNKPMRIVDIVPTIRATHYKNGDNQPLVLAIPKSTNMQSKFTKGTSTMTTTETSPKLMQTSFLTSTVLLEDSLAKLLASLESDEALKIPEGHYSLTLREYLKLKHQDSLCLKMSKDFLVTTTAILSKPSSLRLMSWGTTVNGKCLTARIMESPKTGSVSSLSDILEEQPDPKYFLSEKMTKFLLNDRGKFPPQLLADITNKDNQTRTSLTTARQALGD